jgi:hypothetical protein
MRAWTDGSARIVGLAVGVALAMVVILAWRIPGGDGSLGASLTFSAAPTGELGVEPAGILISEPALRPAMSVEGAMELLNQTASTLEVSLRALPSNPDLDRLLMVEVLAGGEPLFSGTLGALRRWTRTPLVLESGESRTLDVRAWFPGTVRTGYEGRIEQVPLQFRSSAVEA